MRLKNQVAGNLKHRPIEVLGIGSAACEATTPHFEVRATEEAVRQAYELTGLSGDDLDLFYANDFIITSHLVSAEIAGYLPYGEGWKYICEGRTAWDGDKPINTNGGRTSFGHAHAASGLADVYEAIKRPGDRFAGAAFTSGSAGTMSAGDLLKEKYPHLKLAVGEALQCPTILENGFGGHRIEGIGDKHIPWIHNVKNTDMVIDIDDEDSQRLLRLFNTPEGQAYLKNELHLDDELIEKLTWLGISGIANVLCCIKMAKYYEFTERDVVGTVLTDSAVMYGSRIQELNDRYGAYNPHEAAMDHALHMLGLKLDNMQELTYADRKRVHNLKYYTWVEQQGKTVEELNALWYDTEGTWDTVHAQAKDLDDLINAFNEATGLLKDL